jgi:hypothetical protein
MSCACADAYSRRLGGSGEPARRRSRFSVGAGIAHLGFLHNLLQGGVFCSPSASVGFSGVLTVTVTLARSAARRRRTMSGCMWQRRPWCISQSCSCAHGDDTHAARRKSTGGGAAVVAGHPLGSFLVEDSLDSRFRRQSRDVSGI